MGFFRRHWRGAGGFLLWLIRTGGDVDFIVSLANRSAFGRAMITYLTSLPGSILFMVGGLALIWWDFRRSKSQPTHVENLHTYQRLAGTAFQAMGDALVKDTPLIYENAIGTIEPIFLLLKKAGIAIPRLRRDGCKLGILRAHRYLNLLHGPLSIGDEKEAKRRAKLAVPLINGVTEKRLWRDVERLGSPSPDPSGVAPSAPQVIIGGLAYIDDQKTGLIGIWLKISNPNDMAATGLRATLVSSEPPLSEIETTVGLPVNLVTKTRLDRARAGIEEFPQRRFDIGPRELKQVEVLRLRKGQALEGWTAHEGGELHYRLYEDHQFRVEVTGSGRPAVGVVVIKMGENSQWSTELIIEGVGEAHGQGGFGSR